MPDPTDGPGHEASASRPDPADTVTLDARNLRGIAHPLRVRLLGLLRTEGPSTATRLAGRLGLSSAATSYHLRQLALYGFVVEDEQAAAAGRERWWRAAHRGTVLQEIPDEPVAAAAAQEYLRVVAARYAAKIDQWLAEGAQAPPEWREASTLSDTMLLLTAEESRELAAQISELVESRRPLRPDEPRPAGAQPVVVQWQVLPQLRGAW